MKKEASLEENSVKRHQFNIQILDFIFDLISVLGRYIKKVNNSVSCISLMHALNNKYSHSTVASVFCYCLRIMLVKQNWNNFKFSSIPTCRNIPESQLERAGSLSDSSLGFSIPLSILN